MHIPDGLMDPIVALVGTVEFLAIVGSALAISSRRTTEKDLPRVAVLCAGIFVAQMLNFPVGGGTTGHLIGAALLAIMIGPVLAILGMTVVLIIQALMFGDGGITALGLNGLNMAIIAPLVGWGVYSLVHPISKGLGRSGDSIAVAAAAWASVFTAAAACAAELAVSYSVSDGAYGIAGAISVPAMLGYHAVIGIGETLITVGVVAYVRAASPSAFSRAGIAPPTETLLVRLTSSKVAMASVAILVVFALSLPFYFLYSSSGSDGLEQTMEDADVGERDQILSSPFSYGDGYFTALFAGLLGFLAVALAALGVLKLFGRGPKRD
jgi:cobalt/nickel transport system permease protein